MKTSELIKKLEDAGCELKRHGSNHDIWCNPKTGKEVKVGRHAKDVPKGTASKILKTLGAK